MAVLFVVHLCVCVAPQGRSYSSVTLFRPLMIGAVLGCNAEGRSCWVSDRREVWLISSTLKLIDRLCSCFAEASTDEDHPAVRYGRQLGDLKKKLSVMSDPTNVNSPTGGHTVPLPTPPRPAESPWSLPLASTTPNISFSYPDDIGTMAPPHQQPMTEVYPQDPNLGFATLDDWFGQTTQDGDIFGGLDLQEFWFQVGPGEVSRRECRGSSSWSCRADHQASGGFPFR